jgi:hypothetical protein
MSYLGQLPTCSTPYFGPYPAGILGVQNGVECIYEDNVVGCCDPSATVFGTTPPTVPTGSVNLDYGTVNPDRTCQIPFYSSKYGDFNLYTDRQGFCDPTNTNATAPGLGLMNVNMVLMIMAGLAVLVIAGTGGGGGGSRRRRR